MDKCENEELRTIYQNFTMKLDKALKEILSEIKKLNVSPEIIKNKETEN